MSGRLRAGLVLVMVVVGVAVPAVLECLGAVVALEVGPRVVAVVSGFALCVVLAAR